MKWKDDMLLDKFDEKATARKIGQLMDQSGLSDKEISERRGLSVQSVNKWRHGRVIPDIENLLWLSRILGLKVDDFLELRARREIELEEIPDPMLRRLLTYAKRFGRLVSAKIKTTQRGRTMEINENIVPLSLNQEATGRKIKEIMKQKKISNMEISKIMGVSVQAVYRWQNGETLPTISNFFVLSQLLNTDVDEMLVANEP